MAKKRYDVDAIRDACRGQWIDILSALGGVGVDLMDGSHHPCPKCGGTDRFRAFGDVADKGGLICNQCFSKNNGDGFASLGWLMGVEMPKNFVEVVDKVATYLGIKPVSDTDPAKDLKFQEWNEALAALYCSTKGGVTPEALLANGARMAEYKGGIPVIAFPIIGQDLDVNKPVGWVLTHTTGAKLPKLNKKGEEIGTTTWKITYGSKPGLVGTHAIARLLMVGMIDVVWKCEGMSDMLSLFSAIPEPDRDRHVCLTNANGSREIPRWQAGALGHHNVHVVHDADEPGQSGALTWSQGIAAQQPEGKETKNVQLPYTISMDHGKDLRDYLLEGHRFEDLKALADQTDGQKPLPKTLTGEIDYSVARYPYQERVLKKLQLEVLYEEEDGAIRVFSINHKKSATIKNVNKVTKDDLLQICGPQIMEVVTNDQPDGDSQFSIKDVRTALALFAGAARGKRDEKGVGVWQGKTRFDHASETIVLVNRASGARWNGDKVLRPIVAPKADGLTLHLGSSNQDWFDFETLERHMKSSEDLKWCEDVMGEAYDLFCRWNWSNNEIAPNLMVGLVMASFIQTIWAWRPLVSVTGESGSGKSILFEALAGVGGTKGIFGKLEFKSEKSTVAGITQGIGDTAKIIMLDEFEFSKDRETIMEMLRVSTRGGRQSQGSSGGKAVSRQLQHIVWVAAIETGLHRQPDANRFIQLKLLPADKEKQNQLRLPSESALETLGQKLLAVSVRYAIAAKNMAMELKSVSAPGIDARAVESYSVPAAMLAVASGKGLDHATKVLMHLLTNVEREEQGTTDQEELIDEILNTSIMTGPKFGTRTIAQILTSGSLLMELHERLEAEGLRLMPDGALFIVHRKVAKLLDNTRWRGQRIDEILMRLRSGSEKASRSSQRVAGKPCRGVRLPASYTPTEAQQQLPLQDADASNL